MATKYKIIMIYSDGTEEEEDDLFDDQASAEEYAQYLCGCYHQGGEILNMSNPGDYPLDEDDDVDYEIVEIED